MASSRTYSLLAASEDLSAFKSCRFQALLPDCSQSPWPHAKLFLDLLSTANSLEKQACPRPPTLAVKSVLCIVWHEQVHLSVFLSPHHSLTCQSPTAVLTTCGSQTHRSRTEALGQDPNIGSFLDPLKLVEMQRPLCQSVLQQNDCFRTMDTFSGEIPWDEVLSSFIWFVIVSHWSTQSTILREIILPTHRKQSAFTTWEGQLGVILDFLWKQPDVQQLPREQTDREELLPKEQRKKQEMLLHWCNISLSWALYVILVASDKKDIIAWKKLLKRAVRISEVQRAFATKINQIDWHSAAEKREDFQH